jgi:hypothetical protein
MTAKLHYNAILRVMLGLNPAYDWAVEHFVKMRQEMPNFDEVYAGLQPQAFQVVELTNRAVRLEVEPGVWEWHSRENYIIVPSVISSH